MPLINGRYHINPTMGDALEAAREAEAALVAAQQHAARGDSADSSADPQQGTDAAPIHRIEIDAQMGPPGRRLVEPGESSIVPHATGRASRGFVARVHRAGTRPGSMAAPETHVFADHRDLLDFLRDALAEK